MVTAEQLDLAEIGNLQEFYGVSFPQRIKFRQILVTGPPGAGKSALIEQIHGWPYEGHLNLSVKKWWRAHVLDFRPREIHLSAPFVGHKEALAVVDPAWIEATEPLKMDLERIRIPPERARFRHRDWRRYYAFDVLLPPADVVFRDRVERAKTGFYRGDRNVSRDLVVRQLDFYRTIAWYLWSHGMNVYVRCERAGTPKRIVGLNDLGGKDLPRMASADGLGDSPAESSKKPVTGREPIS
jgi:hypothetical protein